MSFGGPIQVFRHLVEGLAADGHTVEVLTTSLTSLEEPGTLRTAVVPHGQVTVRYLATPLRFRWMGVTPSLPLHLRNTPRPDLVHVFGYRDPLGTAIATWARARRIPYAFEGLGMVAPKLRKIRLKRALDSTVLRGVLRGASLLVAASERERDEYLAAGAPSERIAIRPNGFPAVVAPPPGSLRRRIGVDAPTPVVLSVGRIARGKGLELLLGAVAALPGVHAAVVGSDGGHGLTRELDSRRRQLGIQERIHLLGTVEHGELAGLYTGADVFVLASAHENFGLVAAEAAALGVPVVVSDRCGVAELLGDGALVIGYSQHELREAIARLLADRELRADLGRRGREIAAAWPWARVVRLQEELYERVLGR